MKEIIIISIIADIILLCLLGTNTDIWDWYTESEQITLGHILFAIIFPIVGVMTITVFLWNIKLYTKKGDLK